MFSSEISLMAGSVHLLVVAEFSLKRWQPIQQLTRLLAFFLRSSGFTTIWRLLVIPRSEELFIAAMQRYTIFLMSSMLASGHTPICNSTVCLPPLIKRYKLHYLRHSP